MGHEWEAGRHYNVGDKVYYNGQDYNVIQAHNSQGDWRPDQVPALYGPGGHHGEHGGQHGGGGYQQHQHQQQHQNPFQGGNFPNPQSQTHGYQHHPPPGEGNVLPTGPPPANHYSEQAGFNDKGDNSDEDEEKKTDKKKLALEIAGGLGLAAAIGGGIFAYTKHKSKKAEEAKQEVWAQNASQSNWEFGAAARTRDLNSMGNKPPVYWVLTERDRIPDNAVQVGHEADGTPLYAARAFFEGGLMIGKAGRHLRPAGANISYGGRSHTVEKYEVLVGDPRAITWKRFDGEPKVRGWQPVDAGRESNGTYIFLGKSDNYNGSVQIGKVADGNDGIWFAYGDAEVFEKPYYIAAYA